MSGLLKQKANHQCGIRHGRQVRVVTADLSDGVVRQGHVFHADNAYFLTTRASAVMERQNPIPVSNDGIPGFGGTKKAVLLAEAVIEENACTVGKDALGCS